ncbi:HEAT repeat domain-containing protein [Phormidium sp. CCY1219]|uniref:HEAT repeat domain-containing protein n=1 Tax=Phormidium sp. CCY1219 TaxID=2886104 RepID=UPI002D7A01C0|nr:HEAT repeat domain-containing protein [Phormidium sp. CCY1219]
MQRKLIFAPKIALLCLCALGVAIAQIEAQASQQIEIVSSLGQLKTETGANRRQAINTLRRIGSPAVPALLDALRDEDKEVRSAATFALGAMGADATEAIPALINSLTDADDRLRLDAAVALRKIGAPAVSQLNAALKHSELNVRRGAAFALAGIGAPAKEAIPNLVQTLAHADDRLSWNAAVALRAIGSPAIPALTDALNHENPQVRQGAAFALGNVTSPTVATVREDFAPDRASLPSPETLAQENSGEQNPDMPQICDILPTPESATPKPCQVNPTLEEWLEQWRLDNPGGEEVTPDPGDMQLNPCDMQPNPCEVRPNPCEVQPNNPCDAKPRQVVAKADRTRGLL